MKIIKPAKIKPMTCQCCGCVFQAKLKDLKSDPMCPWINDIVHCPICNSGHKAEFEGGENDTTGSQGYLS